MDAFDGAKFRELALYISEKSAEDPRFGSVKLNKILYFSDFEAYRRLGQSITGATYRKLSEGPAPREMLPQRDVMLDSGDIAMEHRPYFAGIQQRVVPKRGARTDLFSAAELAVVNETIEALRHMTAREASDFSHRELGWLAADPGEDIPYDTAWLSSEPVSQEVEEYAIKVAENYGGA